MNRLEAQKLAENIAKTNRGKKLLTKINNYEEEQLNPNKPFSCYGNWFLDMQGWIFWDKKFNIRVDKWEIFTTFCNDEIALSMIYKGIHPRYERRVKPKEK